MVSVTSLVSRPAPLGRLEDLFAVAWVPVPVPGAAGPLPEVVRAGGGWSCLVDAVALGMDAPTLSDRLLRRGRVAATPMTAWGEHVAPRYVRLVYSNEPVSRLADLRARFDAAL